jgi:Uma2 family endonuclease
MSIYEPETRTIIGPELNGTLMTPEEFDSIPPECWNEFYTYELIQGVLVVSPEPSAAERGPNEWLGHRLLTYKELHSQGSHLDWTVPEQSIPTGRNRRRADRMIWTGLGRMPNLQKDVPTIVVEFVSPGRRSRHRDYVTKRDEYTAVGIREYWIIDRFKRQMTVMLPSSTGIAEQVFGENDIYGTMLLPGFELPLGQLFALADSLRPSD